jgi:hypothetical protein
VLSIKVVVQQIYLLMAVDVRDRTNFQSQERGGQKQAWLANASTEA